MSRGAEQQVPHGGLFYDDEAVLSRYSAHRRWAANPNVVMEEPALFAALGEVRGLRVLDLGCGGAALGRTLLDRGCRSYHGVDSSQRMIEQARQNLEGTQGDVEFGTIEDFGAPPNSFDVVVSRLAFHYIEHIDPVLQACHLCLVDSGHLVFTVVHPVITSHDAHVAGEKRTSWLIDDYFVRGARARNWMGGETVWFHRTVEDYIRAIQHSGFRLTRLSECPPTETLRTEEPEEYQRRSRVPLFLLLAAEKM